MAAMDAAQANRRKDGMQMEKTLRYGKGYSGKMSHKCWVASITGTDKQYGLVRDFIEPTKVEREHFNRSRTMIDFTWDLDDGLYEMSEGGDRWFLIVCHKDGKQIKFVPTEERVKAMVALMDQGKSFEDARIATRKTKEPVPAQTT